MPATSPNDNIQMKDALSANFKMRGKDVSTAQDGSIQQVRHLSVPYPIDYGIGGCFQFASKSGAMAAGLAASAPIFGFRWTSSTLYAILQRLRITAWSTGTGFTAGLATFDLFKASSWTVADTGGTTESLVSPNAKLRASMAASSVAEIRRSTTATLTAGTRTLDAQPSASITKAVSNAVNTLFVDHADLFYKPNAEHPLLLTQNEGFVIQATVPATGTWAFTIHPEWAEVSAANY